MILPYVSGISATPDLDEYVIEKRNVGYLGDRCGRRVVGRI
jgi:hypothetical protein